MTCTQWCSNSFTSSPQRLFCDHKAPTHISLHHQSASREILLSSSLQVHRKYRDYWKTSKVKHTWNMSYINPVPDIKGLDGNYVAVHNPFFFNATVYYLYQVQHFLILETIFCMHYSQLVQFVASLLHFQPTPQVLGVPLNRGQNFTQAQCSGKRMRVLNSSCTQRLLPFICRLKMIPCEQQTICTFLLIIHSTIWHKSLPKQTRSLFFQQRIKVCINSRLLLLQKMIKPTKRGRLSHKVAINVNQNSIYNVWKIFQCFHVL